MTVATPLESVTAVAFAGTNAPNVLSVVNVTTAPATGTLVADLNVALTLAGLPGAIVVTAAFVVGSVRVSVSVGGAAGGVPPPPEPPDDVPPETPLPPQADNTAEMSGTNNNNRPRCAHRTLARPSFALLV